MLDRVIALKYPIVIAFFLVWMFFFDTNSIVFMYKQYNELKDLKLQEQFLVEEIAEMKKQRDELLSSEDNLEQFARERYFFKRDDEDVYVFKTVED